MIEFLDIYNDYIKILKDTIRHFYFQDRHENLRLQGVTID